MPYRALLNYPVEHQFIQTNGVTLHVVQAGPADGPLVLLLHGFPEFWFGWRKQIPALAAAGFRVWAPDQRGYNLSDRPRGVRNYTLDKLAQDIVGLIDAAGVEQAAIVGHDWGAAVGWQLGMAHAERVRRLAILNVPHPAVLERFLRSSREQLRRSWYIFFFQLPWLPERLLATRLDDLLRSSSHPGVFTDELLQVYYRAWRQPGAVTAMLNWYRAVVRGWRPNRPWPATPVQPPTQIIWGAQDIALSPALAQPSVDLCRDGRLTFFPDATHWVQHDAPEAVNALLIDFLRG